MSTLHKKTPTMVAMMRLMMVLKMIQLRQSTVSMKMKTMLKMMMLMRWRVVVLASRQDFVPALLVESCQFQLDCKA